MNVEEINVFETFTDLTVKPKIYTKSSDVLWTDEHISKGMLAAHLDPDSGGASRTHTFIQQSVGWIAKVANPETYPKLLDLGCGPGIYAEKFHEAGYQVTGVDFSKRSIDYAREQANQKDLSVEYIHQNYLTIDYKEIFDMVTLIYTDYCVLSPVERKQLLKLVYQTLKPGGKFIFDVSKPVENTLERKNWKLYPKGGFFSEEPHLHLEAIYYYPQEEGLTQLTQHLIINEKKSKNFYVWHDLFSEGRILKEMASVSFKKIEVFGDVAGAPVSENKNTLCLVATK